MNVFKIFIKALQITYSKNFIKSIWYIALPGLLILIGSLIAIIPAVIISAIQKQGLQFDIYASYLIIGFCAIIGIAILCKGFWEGLLAYLVVIFMTKNAHKNENILTKKEYLILLNGKKGKYAQLLLAIAAIILIPMLLLPVLAFLANTSLLKILTVLYVFIAIASILFISIKLCFAYQFFAFKPAYTIKQIISSTYSLTNSYFWQTLGLFVLIQIPQQLIVFLTSFITSKTITFILVSLFSVIYAPINIVAITLWYFEVRRRKNT